MSLPDDYQTLRNGAAIGAISPRRQIAVAGADRASYLQGLLTNDIQALSPGQGCYAAWLTPQGRMLTDMDVLESGDMILLDVPADRADSTLQRLDEFLFAEDVRLSALDGSLAGVWIHGPEAARVVERAVSGLQGLAAWPDYRLARAEFGGAPAVVARMDRLAVPGFCVYLEPSAEGAFTAALQTAGAAPVAADALEARRIEVGYPLFGVDMNEETIPLEAGIENRAISFSKGCYVGQEVIIRVLHRGHGRVARRLVGLRIDGPAAARGTALAAGDREVGRITSAAASPRLGTLALGYVHRDFVAPGTALQSRIDGRLVEVAVRELEGRRAPETAPPASGGV
jgi:folate-binding protein YgfZ